MTTFRVPIEQLRRDVRLLGQLLGEILVEQSGPTLLELVEQVRAQAIADRERGQPLAPESIERIARLPLETMEELVRAFTLYFYLVNAAEENHRLRSLRQREQADPAGVRPESIAAAVRTLRARGVEAAELQGFLNQLSISPVLTAHPSEARRRTVLQHLRQMASLIEEADRGREPAENRERLAEVLTLLWQTDQVRVTRPTPLDELQTGMFFFEGTLLDQVPRLYRELELALREQYPERVFTIPPFLRFSSWITGDRDGNPSVTNETTRAALEIQRATILRRYREDVDELIPILSPSVRRIGVSAELLDAIASRGVALGPVGQSIVERNPVEPYRQVLGIVNEQLHRTVSGVGGAYRDANELIRDLEIVQRSVRAHRGQRIADGKLGELIWRVRVFGLHLAELELRQHSQRHESAIAEVFNAAGVCADYRTLDEAARVALLATEIASRRPLIPAELAYQPSTNEVIDLFRTIRRAQQRFGRAVCQRYVVSMTHDVSDVLVVVLLAKEAGLIDLRDSERLVATLQVVPLFEGIGDLERCPTILRCLLETPVFRSAVAAVGDVQEIMLGYSDSNKDGGYLSSNAHLWEAQDRLAAVCRDHGVQVELFHGRGGAIGRGGGPMGRAIAALSAPALNNRLKFTEQGEVVFARYGNPGIAHRHLEQMVHAAFLSALRPQPLAARSETIAEWRATLGDLANRSFVAYRGLLDRTSGFERYFRDSTPFPELAQYAIASRPVSRSATQRLEDIRAIPWVFSWTQSRVNLPGWYGFGSAVESWLADNPGGGEELKLMYLEWPVFGSIVDNCQISLALADLTVARLYRDAVPDAALAQHVYQLIAAEFERTQLAMVELTGQPERLGHSSVLAQSVRLRNPYVDPISAVQATLLRNLRRGGLYGDRRPVDLVLQTINGIAAGLQTTG